MELYFHWLQNNLLTVASVVITLVLIYHYLIEREAGVKLSKRYRNSIYEAQSKIFLNATQYLISGEKDLAIREFLNAVDINRETLDTYFALGNLFRSNGEYEKAISIHRSLIARESISEMARLQALKELAIDFDKGGFIDKAIETYREVLKINRDQVEVVLALCRIYEDIEDWDQAFKYRLMLSKIGHDDQSETISHILVQKGKGYFAEGNFAMCDEELDNALKYAPSVSASILNLRMQLIKGNLDSAKSLLVDLLKEYPFYATFIHHSLNENFKAEEKEKYAYYSRLTMLRNYFLGMDDKEMDSSPAVILSKIKLFKDDNKIQEAYNLLTSWMETNKGSTEVLKIEYIKLLIELGKSEEALKHTGELLENINQSLARFYCHQCGYNSDQIFWRCPQCHEWETIQFRWKV